jgi:hypothetical protein
MARSNVHPIVKLDANASVAPTVLGNGPARIPTGGKIRAGIKVLTHRAAELPLAREIYDEGVAAGRSFAQIERTLAEALPDLKAPLVPRNVPWFTVREQDFQNPAIARQIIDAYSEDRGEGRRVYRFPIVFPSDHWQTVMPHELAAWGAHEKRYWSEYSADGRVRHCKCHAPATLDDSGKRAVRLFGGSKTMLRDDNHGLCEPEACHEYQQRQCNLSGRFLFFIPGIRSISAFELHTNSFYAMNAAIQKFETIGFLRGGRISGFLDRQRTPFFLSKKLMAVAHIDEEGRRVRVRQWIIELEAPVDVAALMRDGEDAEAAIEQAQLASQLLGGPRATVAEAAHDQATPGRVGEGTNTLRPTMRGGEPSLDKVLARGRAVGIDADRYERYAGLRWGPGWKLNPQGRRRAWDEFDRYRNDGVGYCDKIESELQLLSQEAAR